jgi:hypothetical protein
MVEEQAQETSDNQTGTEGTEETQPSGETEQGGESEGTESTTTETAEPEFKDPNMQSAFTKKMQELSEIKQSYEGRMKSYDEDKKYADTMRELRGNPEFVKWYRQQVGQEEKPQPIPEISEDEWTSAITDRRAAQRVIDQRAEMIAEQKMQSLRQEVDGLKASNEQMRLVQVVDDFASATDKSGKPLYPDFYDLDEKGYIEQNLKYLQGAKMDPRQKIDFAYKMAKYPHVKEDAIKAAHRTVETKRKAIGEPGTGSPAVVPDMKGKSLREVYEFHKKRLGVTDDQESRYSF